MKTNTDLVYRLDISSGLISQTFYFRSQALALREIARLTGAAESQGYIIQRLTFKRITKPGWVRCEDD